MRINQVLRVNAVLQIGRVTETVTVQASAVMLETETGSLGQVISNRSIAELPLNGRNLTQLAALSAGISPKSSQRGSQYGGREQYVTIEGGRDSSTNYLIDGVMARSLRFNNLSVQMNVDAIQEFKVNRNAFSAEFGQGQSVITAVSKSGTNDLHGTVYEFLRNDKLDARKFFDARQPEFRRNQFGATAGGPLVKNRVFLFAGYEGLREAQGQTSFGTVPDPVELRGDLSRAARAPIDYETGQAFPNGIIPDQRISRFARVYRQWFPAPNRPGNRNNYRRVGDFEDSWDSIILRSDQNLTSKHTLFQRYMWYDGERLTPGSFQDISYPQKGQNASVQSTYTVTPSSVNEFKIGYNRAEHIALQVNPGGNPVQELGLRNLAGGTDPINFGVPNVNITGFSSPGNQGFTQGATENIYTLADNLSIVRGAHTAKMGFEVQHRRFFHLTEVPPRGAFNFNGQYTRVPMADYLLGVSNQSQGALGSSRSNYRSNYFGLFLQDDWRIHSRVTLNLGLRYEFAAPWKEENDMEGYFEPSTGLITYHRVPEACLLRWRVSMTRVAAA